jgi:predicted Na+-dependent transporter
MKIARSLIVLMLIPLAVGLLVRARRPGAASRIRPTVGWISNISMILVGLEVQESTAKTRELESNWDWVVLLLYSHFRCFLVAQQVSVVGE